MLRPPTTRSTIPRRTMARPPRWRRLRRAVLPLAVLATSGAVPAPAFAADGPTYLAAKSLNDVISSLQGWVMTLLLAVATLFAVLAGVYWVTAGGDPAQVDKAKGALKNALIGYGLAVLAPVLLDALKGIVGGP